MYMVMGSAMGIGTAAGVAIGQSLGARDITAVKRVVGCAIAFVGVVLLHGGYDFVLAAGFFDTDLSTILSMAVLGFVAYQFFDTLANENLSLRFILSQRNQFFNIRIF